MFSLSVRPLRTLLFTGAGAAVLCLTSAANAMPTLLTTLEFERISSNGSVNVEDSLFVDIIDPDDGVDTSILFNFRFVGTNGFISDIYFDADNLLTIDTLIDADEGTGGDDGVDFSAPISGGENFPEGNNLTPDFETTSGLSADEDPRGRASSTNRPAIQDGETLGILMNIIAGKNIDDVLFAFAINPTNFPDYFSATDPNADGTARIGIHVQGMDDGESDSFVNTPYEPEDPEDPPIDPEDDPAVPEPATAGLLAMGVLGLVARRRRR